MTAGFLHEMHHHHINLQRACISFSSGVTGKGPFLRQVSVLHMKHLTSACIFGLHAPLSSNVWLGKIAFAWEVCAVHERLHSGAGLADPGPIASALWVDTELHSSVCLDSIVTVVDAHNLKKQLQESGSHDSTNEAERQIAFADTILLNKVGPAKALP